MTPPSPEPQTPPKTPLLAGFLLVCLLGIGLFLWGHKAKQTPMAEDKDAGRPVAVAGSAPGISKWQGKGEAPAPGTAPGGPSAGMRKVTFVTNWYAEAEHGGFYQAVAKGYYRNRGLDVTIKMGGAQINGNQLLVSGAVDFYMGTAHDALRAVEEKIPLVTVAAFFQKDPQILMAHPGVGNESFEAAKGKPVFASATASSSYWPFLTGKFGYTDEMKRPYSGNFAPFLADKESLQQGYLTSEPYKIEKMAGFKPVVLLMADRGYLPYAETIMTTQAFLSKERHLIFDFVEASVEGWYSYLADPVPGNELIKRDNPEMTDDVLAASLDAMRKAGLVTSGDAERLGIGAMTDARWKDYFESMVSFGVYKPTTDYRRAYTLDFINHGPPPGAPKAH